MTSDVTHLLDASALIALVVAEHEHHERVAAWSAAAGPIAICPVTEGAMVRYLLRVGESTRTVSQLLADLHRSTRTSFWPDSISYASVGLDHIIGYRQVTDTYLAALAASHGGRLATFNKALAATFPDQVVLIP